MSSGDMLLRFSAWSLLSLTAKAHGVPMYRDELGSATGGNDIASGRYISCGEVHNRGCF